MIINMALEDDLLEVLQRMSASLDVPVNEVAAICLRDWAIAQGFLPADDELDEDTPTEGNA